MVIREQANKAPGAGWHFDHQSRVMNVQPIENKLFTKDALVNIVSEGFQNSLDAVLRDIMGKRGRVEVRISLRKIPLSRLKALGFEDIIRRAKASGYQVELGDEIVILEFSDNGTGLDYATHERFARRLGESGKDGSAGGRHGCGRTVLMHSSAVHAMYAHSVSNKEDRLSLFTGMASLRLHELDGEKFQAYGAFGSDDGGDDIAPAEGDEAFRLAGLLGSERQRGENGLSIFVPALADNFGIDKLIAQIATKQFVPILSGQLSVVLDDKTSNEKTAPVVLSKDTLVDIVSGLLRRNNRYAKNPVLNDLHSIATAVLGLFGDDVLDLDDSTLENISPEKLEVLKHKWDAGMPAVITFPVTADHASNGAVSGKMRICLLRDDHLTKPHEVFVRDGITLRDKGARGEPCVILTMAADDKISGLLGDAETADHMRWEESIATSKGWLAAERVIDLFSNAGRKLLSKLQGVKSEVDFSFFADLFPMLDDSETQQSSSGGRKPPVKQTVTKVTKVTKDDEDVGNGLLDRKGSRDENTGLATLNVKFSPRGRRYVASKGGLSRLVLASGYASIAGNSINGYALNDYNLADFEIKVKGADRAIGKDNRIIIENVAPNMDLTIKGPLDTKRDIEIVVAGKE